MLIPLNILYFFYLFTILPLLIQSLGSSRFIFNYLNSFPLAIFLIGFPILLDLNHSLNRNYLHASMMLLLLFVIKLIFFTNREVDKTKILRSIILSALANFGIFIFLYLINDLASQFHQYTPDTYVYEFIARAVGSPEGLIGLDAGWLLLRGIVLPSVITVFFPNFEPWILPFVIYIFLFLLFIYFSLQSINNTRKHKRDFYLDVLIATLIFSIFLFSLQGAYLTAYITTHAIVSICVLIFFYIIYEITVSKTEFNNYHLVILLSTIFVFCLIRPEGAFLSIFAIMYLIFKLKINFYLALIIINFQVFICVYWFFSVYFLTRSSTSLILAILFMSFGGLGNLFILVNRLNFHNKLEFLTKVFYLLFAIGSISYSFKLMVSTLPNCFRSLFLNEGGLGLIPYVLIVIPVLLLTSKNIKNNLFINISLLGIASSYLIYPVLNQNSWFCESSGWGGSLPRSWIHFVPLLGVGIFNFIQTNFLIPSKENK